MSESMNIITFYKLNESEIRVISKKYLQPYNSIKGNVSDESVTKKEFIEKLKNCFVQLYPDMYLSTNIAFMDDVRIKSEWISKALSEAKKYYAAELQDSEHIFLLKEPKSRLFRNPITKNFIDDLSGGFIVTDRFLYIDKNTYNNLIPISEIIRFESRLQPSNNDYIITVIYYDNQKEAEYYLLRLDSRAYRLCDRMNEFLSIYRKYHNNLLD